MKVYRKKLFFICPIYNKKRSVISFAAFVIGTFDASGKYQDNLYFLSHSMFDNVAQFVKQQ